MVRPCTQRPRRPTHVWPKDAGSCVAETTWLTLPCALPDGVADDCSSSTISCSSGRPLTMSAQGWYATCAVRHRCGSAANAPASHLEVDAALEHAPQRKRTQSYCEVPECVLGALRRAAWAPGTGRAARQAGTRAPRTSRLRGERDCQLSTTSPRSWISQARSRPVRRRSCRRRLTSEPARRPGLGRGADAEKAVSRAPRP